MKLLARGAEAELYSSDFMGKKAVVKRRDAKEYRIPEIDIPLRTGRTKGEARLLHSAKEAGVLCPLVFQVHDCDIVMKRIGGTLLKDAKNKSKYLKKLGRALACLHSKNIVHGDFTTANAIAAGKKVYVIDFGLGGYSKELEEKAIDVLLMKRSLSDKKLFPLFLSGYSHYERAADVLRQMKEIEKRGRYVVR